MCSRSSILCALALIATAMAVSAQPLPVYIPFEPPLYAPGQIGGQDGWLNMAGPNANHLIQTTVVNAGVQAGLLNSVGVGGINQVGKVFNVDMANQTLRVELQVFIANAPNEVHNVWSIEPQAPGGDLIAFQVNNTGNIRLVGAVTTNTAVPFPYNQWNSVRLDINFITRTVDAYLNGTLVATNLAFHPNAGASTVFYGLTLASLGPAQTERMYFDDLRINGGLDETSGVFQLKYFNINYGSGHIIVSNAGTLSSGNNPADDSSGTLCANFYSFDPNEEMQTCCSCPVTPNGLSSLNVNEDIIAQNLIVNPSTAITVKVLFTSKAAQNAGGICDPSKVTALNLARGGLAWGTNLRNVTFQGSPPSTVNAVTETKFTKAELSLTELSKLATYCQYIKILGSQVSGICKSCQAGARGAISQ